MNKLFKRTMMKPGMSSLLVPKPPYPLTTLSELSFPKAKDRQLDGPPAHNFDTRHELRLLFLLGKHMPYACSGNTHQSWHLLNTWCFGLNCVAQKDVKDLTPGPCHCDLI